MIRVLAALFSAFMLVVVLATGVGLIMFYRYGKDLPDIRQLATYEPPVTTRVYSGDGRLLAEYAAEKRVFVPIGSIPPRLVEAFLSAEDKNFYEHKGIDTAGVIRAILTNLENLGSDRRLVGASTIPQQVAKNFLLSSEVSFDRKIKEAILALRMDQALSKQRILELYLNEIYLGSGAYGVAAAALNYFDKSLDELTLPEMATLAALPKAPSNYDPIRQPAAAKARRDWVIGRMLEDGHITRGGGAGSARRAAGHSPRQDGGAGQRGLFRRGGPPRPHPALRRGCALQGRAGRLRDGRPALQEIADKTLRRGLEEYDRQHGWRGPIAPSPSGGSPAAAAIGRRRSRGLARAARRDHAATRARQLAPRRPPAGRRRG